VPKVVDLWTLTLLNPTNKGRKFYVPRMEERSLPCDWIVQVEQIG